MKNLVARGGDRVHRFEIYKRQNVQDNIKAFLAELTTCCRAAPLDSGGLCQVKAESSTIDGWNHFIEATAFRLKSSVTLSGCTTGSP